jgi:hypothetical protein
VTVIRIIKLSVEREKGMGVRPTQFTPLPFEIPTTFFIKTSLVKASLAHQNNLMGNIYEPTHTRKRLKKWISF